MSEAYRCLVCLHDISQSHPEDYTKLDMTSNSGNQTYRSLVEIILTPIYGHGNEALYLCQECSDLVNEFELKEIQLKKIRNTVQLKYRSAHTGNKFAKIPGGEDLNDSINPPKTVNPHSEWHDPPPNQQKNTEEDDKIKVPPSGQPKQQKSSSKARLWTVSSDGQTYQCSLCNKQFAHRTYMYTHVRIHTGARPHPCTCCTRSFRSSSALSEHVRSAHSGSSQFSCELCGQTFVHSSSLRQHLRRHRQQAAHRCPDCDKTFHRAAHLREHAAVHSQQRPHGCTECGKTFKNRSGLVYHSRIHSGTRPHQCAICRARFRTSSNLARHSQTQHGGAAHAAPAPNSASDRAPPLPPPPRPVVQVPQSPPPAPRFDLLQPAGLVLSAPDMAAPCQAVLAPPRGPQASPPVFDRPLHELLPVPLEAYRPV